MRKNENTPKFYSKADISSMTDAPKNHYQPDPNRNLPAPPLPPRQQSPLTSLPPHNPTPAPAAYQEPVKVDILAILSLVLNFVSLSLVSIILGHIALKRTHKGRGDGYGIALAGTIIGYVATVFVGLGVAAAIILPIFLNQQINAVTDTVKADVKATVSQIQTGEIPLDVAEKQIDTGTENEVYVETDGTAYIVYGGNPSLDTYIYWYDSATGQYTEEDSNSSDSDTQ